MKQILAITIIFYTIVSTAQDFKPIKPILENGIKKQDNAQVAYALKRCITLNLVMGNWMEEKGGENLKNVAKNFFEQGLLLKELSFEIENGIEKSRKTKISTRDELEVMLLSTVKNITPLYVDRLTKNYALSGSYFDNYTMLKDEISICSNFRQYLNSVK
jgi:hypothetical protein